MKASFGLIIIGSVLFALPAQATMNELPVKVIQRTHCDFRAPVVEATVGEGARRIGYAPYASDDIIWLDTHGVEPGTHRYLFERQPFGSERTYVMVVKYANQPHGLVTSKTLTFKRPTKVDCVTRFNPRIGAYSLDVNKSCKRGFDKLLIVTLRVARGSDGYILRPGAAELVKRSGKQLNSLPQNTSIVGGKDGARRQVEYYFFTGRKAKFTLDQTENGIWPVWASSEDIQLVASLDATCMSQVP